jgi:N4-gp56 family major capsid protein
MAGTATVNGAALASTGTGGTLTFKEQMSSIFAVEAENSNPLQIAGMVGKQEEDRNAVIVKLKPLNTGGDSITYSLRMKLKTQGVDGDGVIEGNEPHLEFYADTVKIDQKSFPVKLPGKMGQQYLRLKDLRKEAVSAITVQGGEWEGEMAIKMIAGKLGTNYEILPSTFSGWAGNPLVDVDTDHLMHGGSATSKATLQTTDTFKAADLLRMKTRAKTMSPKVPALKIGGKEVHIVLMHPYVLKDLKTEVGDNAWAAIERAKLQGGQDPKMNGLINAAAGALHGCLLFDYELVPLFTDYGAGSNVTASRVLFLGAQAAVLAFAGPLEWEFEEERFNYKKVYGCNASTIRAVKPTIFGSKRFGMLAMDVATTAA